MAEDATVEQVVRNRPVICSSCSRPTGEFSTSGRYGVCKQCRQSGQEYNSRDEAGNWVSSDASNAIDGGDFAEREPEEDHRPRCMSCGGMTFRFTGTVIATSEYYDYDNETLYFDTSEYEEATAHPVCMACGTTYRGVVDWS